MLIKYMGTDSWDPAFLETKNFTSRGLKFEREITRASYRSPTGPKILHYASEKKNILVENWIFLESAPLYQYVETNNNESNRYWAVWISIS